MIRFVSVVESGVLLVKAVWLDAESDECLAWARYCGLVRQVTLAPEVS